jgi:hypothetical protein
MAMPGTAGLEAVLYPLSSGETQFDITENSNALHCKNAKQIQKGNAFQRDTMFCTLRSWEERAPKYICQCNFLMKSA